MPKPRANNKFFRKLNRFSFGFIEGKINFHEKHNSTYNDNEILQTLLFLSIKNRYPENGCKRCKEIVEKSPDADTLYRRINLKDKEEILREFFFIQKEIITRLRKRRIKRIVVFIDEHEIPWYGKPNPYVVGTNSFNGTNLCFKYITLNALIDNYRICLFALPVTPFSRKDKLVDKLLCVAKKWFKIGIVLFDRGFSKDSKTLKVVEKHGLKYLAPMEKRDRVKRIANLGDGVNPFYHTKYEFGKEKAITNLFFIPNKKHEKEKWKNYHVFCTNVDVTKANLSFLADLYGKRWNIENFYRDAEGNFRIKTKTDDFITRYFFFLFMCIIYNLWYFVRGISPLIAERWKDLIEDGMREEREDKKLLENYLMYYVMMKNLFALFISVTGVSFAFYFIEKACFSAITKMMQNKELKQIVLCIIVSQTRYANNDFLANMRRYCY